MCNLFGMEGVETKDGWNSSRAKWPKSVIASYLDYATVPSWSLSQLFCTLHDQWPFIYHHHSVLLLAILQQ